MREQGQETKHCSEGYRAQGHYNVLKNRGCSTLLWWVPKGFSEEVTLS